MTAQPLSELAAALARLADPAAVGVPDAELLRRFTETRDEAAFELLVWRHGGMVLGTCRRVLGQSSDADDAFQAAFLALARKPGSVRRGESLPGWLHRVALRAALRLRAKRRESLPLPEVAAPPEPLPDDTAAILDEEIGRLPQKLRVAFVLCHLQGHTHEEAAKQLGCPTGTVFSRVARARERLQARLTRRGLALSGGAAFAVEPAAISAALVAHTAHASAAFARALKDAAISGPAATLAHSLLRSMRLRALKPFAAVLAVAVLTVGAVLAAQSQEDHKDPSETPAEPTQPVLAPVPLPPASYKLATAGRGSKFVEEVRFSPDGKWIVTAGRQKADDFDFTLAVWEAAGGKHVRTLDGAADRKLDREKALFGISAVVEFSPAGKLCAVAKPDEPSVALWSVGDWKRLVALPHRYVNGAQFSPDNKLVVTWGWGYELRGKSHKVVSEVKVWDTAGKLVFEHTPKSKEEATVSWATFSPDSKSVAVASDGFVRLLDSTSGKAQAEIELQDRMNTVVKFSPDGTKLFTWTTSTDIKSGGLGMRAIRVWDVATGRQLPEFEGKVEPSRTSMLFGNPRKCATTRDGRWLAATGEEDAVWVWDAATGRKVVSVKLAEADPGEYIRYAVESISFSPDGSLLAVCGSSFDKKKPPLSMSILYSMPGGRELVQLPDVKRVIFSNDGKTVAIVTGGPDQDTAADEVTVCRLADLPKLQRLKDK